MALFMWQSSMAGINLYESYKFEFSIDRYTLTNMSRLRVTRTLSSYDNSKIIKFYEDNSNNTYQCSKSNDMQLTICCYNVHGFININANITSTNNFKNICQMLKQVNADIVILTEVCLAGEINPDEFLKSVADMKYRDHLFVKNSGCFVSRYNTDYLVVLSKQSMTNKQEMACKNKFRFNRNYAYFEINGIKYVAVHLDIGDRFHHLSPDDPKRIKIVKENTNFRIDELKHILPADVILGDFNFSPVDDEFQYMMENKWFHCGDLTDTTPYNRTDMIFIKNGTIKPLSHHVVKCNYSDHLPIVSMFSL